MGISGAVKPVPILGKKTSERKLLTIIGLFFFKGNQQKIKQIIAFNINYKM